MSYKPKRGTVALEDAEIMDHQAFAGQQFILRVRAPTAARRATPGTFAHISVDPAVPLRRPLSIMRANASEGWLEFLYKPKGHGLDKLSARRSGEVLSLLAPIGRGFAPDPARPQLLALGGGVGIPPMIFLADQFRARPEFKTLVLMGSEVPFPFELVASRLELSGSPADATHAVALLERWGVPSRLASNAGLPGCHRGYVTDLARAWLQSLRSKHAPRCRCSRAVRRRCSWPSRSSRASSTFRVSSRSRSSWLAGSAAARDATCCSTPPTVPR